MTRLIGGRYKISNDLSRAVLIHRIISTITSVFGQRDAFRQSRINFTDSYSVLPRICPFGRSAGSSEKVCLSAFAKATVRWAGISGATSEVEIPVPIPNTVVKHFRADDTPMGESRSAPVYQEIIRKDGFLF